MHLVIFFFHYSENTESKSTLSSGLSTLWTKQIQLNPNFSNLQGKRQLVREGTGRDIEGGIELPVNC